MCPARASLGEAQDRDGDGPGHAGEGDDDGAPGVRNRYIYTTHLGKTEYLFHSIRRYLRN